MDNSSFPTIGIAALLVLPGALYVWSFERIVGRWGVGFSDRVLRFLGGSAIINTLFAPLLYVAWARFGAPGTIASGDPVPIVAWLGLIAYMALPITLGHLIGYGVRERWRLVRWLAGPNPAPRSWDHLFASSPKGWIRLRMKTGIWIGGFFASEGDRRSYAAGYPEQQDLLILRAADIDSDTGEFSRDATGDILLSASSLLVRWDEVEYLDFKEVHDGQN